jgi:hypothetical protein
MLMNVNAVMLHAQIPFSAQSFIDKAIRLPRFPQNGITIHRYEFKEFVEIRSSMNYLTKCRNSDIEIKIPTLNAASANLKDLSGEVGDRLDQLYLRRDFAVVKATAATSITILFVSVEARSRTNVMSTHRTLEQQIKMAK